MSSSLKLVEGFVYWFNSSTNIYASALWDSCPVILIDKANAPIVAVVMLKPHWSKDELYADCEELCLCNGQKLNNGHKVDVQKFYTVHSAMLAHYDEMRPHELYLDHNSFVTIKKTTAGLKMIPLSAPGGLNSVLGIGSSKTDRINQPPETPPSKRRWSSTMSTQSATNNKRARTTELSEPRSRATSIKGPSDFIQTPTKPDLFPTKHPTTSPKLPPLRVSKSSIQERLQQTIGRKDRFRVSIPPLQSPRAFHPAREIFVKNEIKEAADLIYEAVQKTIKAQEHAAALGNEDISEIIKWALKREAIATRHL